VLGGTFSAKGSWPWLVYINTGCTGSIVHPNWVITAKHCVFSDNLVVGYGNPNYNRQQHVNVNETFIMKPDCREFTSECLDSIDIALLYLEEPIPITPFSSPVCLKEQISEKWGDLEAAVGWGTFLIPDPESRDGYILERSPNCREVDIPIRAIEQGYCDTLQADDKHEICAGTWNHGSTRGDSGGPTMALINDTWYLHGITSRGKYLQNDDPQMFRPQVIYTDVTSYCDWIADVTKGEVKCQKD
uniref:Peptidase S1 domain-containing protein n=1 Tax=Panagrolaimus sp. JU765 TaxID=591449 RepID=A0AC34Q1N7_9BILA